MPNDPHAAPAQVAAPDQSPAPAVGPAIPVQAAPPYSAIPYSTAPYSGFPVGHPWAAPPVAAKPKTGALAIVTIIVLCLVIAGTGLVGAVTLPARISGSAPSVGLFVDPKGTDLAITTLIADRAKAVQSQNRDAFLAGVDGRDEKFRQRESDEYDNLIKLHLSSFELVPLRGGIEDLVLRNSPVRAAFPKGIRAFKVTVKYAVRGIDDKPLAVPWLPIFGQVDGVWKLGGEMVLSEKADSGRVVTAVQLPDGTGGQPWQGGPITVVEGKQVTVVVSEDDAKIADDLLSLADRAAERVVAKRSKGWSQRILVTALSGGDVYESYFVFDVNGPDAFAALAIKYYEEVPAYDFNAKPKYAGSRVVFNPDQLGEDRTWLSIVLTHEFTHVAMGPFTAPITPRWLVEGIAEYVGYDSAPVDWDFVADQISKAKISKMPQDRTFYNVSNNYEASWVMCRMIAKRYGEAKLFSLYEYFKDAAGDNSQTSWDKATKAVLGVSFSKLETDYRAFSKSPS